MKDNISVLQTVGGLNPSSGGLPRVVVDLADALGNHKGISPFIVTHSVEGASTIRSHNPTVIRVIARSPAKWELRSGLAFRRAFLQCVEENRELGHAMITHNHGLWSPTNHWVCSVAREQNLPMIIQPHGMLEPWALEFKVWKKRFAMALFQSKDLHTAKLLIATADIEYENIRKLGFRQPIAVIPNGVNIDAEGEQYSTRDSKLKDDRRTVLFLSRIHPKKGLLNLLKAWALLDPPGWRMQLAGPNEVGHLEEVMSTAQRLGIESAVEYIGEVDGEDKAAAYRNADLFVLPTFSENFGIVVAEALSYGLPVITTRGAPWSDLVKYGCGWWVEAGVDPLAAALKEALGLSSCELHAMGVKGREYVRRYDWDTIAAQMAEVYKWVLGRGSCPECVRLT